MSLAQHVPVRTVTVNGNRSRGAQSWEGPGSSGVESLIRVEVSLSHALDEGLEHLVERHLSLQIVDLKRADEPLLGTEIGQENEEPSQDGVGKPAVQGDGLIEHVSTTVREVLLIVQGLSITEGNGF
ncbi:MULTISPECIES: hypothetical protein [Actinomyces]|uniref:hypothetical protein n=1 Tax=Actinomyces TaxID=1654 RepID=UPI00159F6A19|nr:MULTISPECIES: hypothetical protein [Actinomyces]